MDMLYANVLNELEKIFRKKRSIIFLLITAVCTILAPLGIIYFQNRLGASVVVGSAYPVSVLGLFVKIFLPVFIFMTGADMFAGEVSDKTLKLALTKPISRMKVFISKNIALLIYALINLMVVFTVSFTAGMFFSIKGDVLSGFVRSLGAYIVAAVPVMVLILIASLIAQFFKGSSSTLTTCILIYVAIYILSMVFPIVDSLSISNLLDWHLLWIGSNFAAGKILNELIQMLAYSIIFFSLGLYVFDGKEI